jgi:hypothetical protein
VENQDYAAFSRRVIRAHARRIADGDIEELTHLTGLERELHNAIHTAVEGLRAQGYSWPILPCAWASPAKPPTNAGPPPKNLTNLFPEGAPCPMPGTICPTRSPIIYAMLLTTSG